MATVFINLHDADPTPSVHVSMLSGTGQRFIVLEFSDRVSVSLAGYDEVAAAHAVALAEALLAAVAQLRTKRADMLASE